MAEDSINGSEQGEAGGTCGGDSLGEGEADRLIDAVLGGGEGLRGDDHADAFFRRDQTIAFALFVGALDGVGIDEDGHRLGTDGGDEIPRPIHARGDGGTHPISDLLEDGSGAVG